MPHSLTVTIAALRAQADELEQQLPVLDSKEISAALASTHDSLGKLRAALPKARRVPMKQYLQARAVWLEAWSRDATHLRRAARSVVKTQASGTPRKPDDDPALEALHWLVEVIAAGGVRKAIELTQWLEPEPESPPDYGLPMDRAANHALQIWGRMKADEFLGRWDLLNADLIKRSAIAVGLPALKRWPQPAREELHRRALRFVRNTMI